MKIFFSQFFEFNWPHTNYCAIKLQAWWLPLCHNNGYYDQGVGLKSMGFYFLAQVSIEKRFVNTSTVFWFESYSRKLTNIILAKPDWEWLNVCGVAKLNWAKHFIPSAFPTLFCRLWFVFASEFLALQRQCTIYGLVNLKNERLSFGESAAHQADTLNRGRIEKIELAYL